MQYNKQAIDFFEQLTTLKSRGLVIDNEDVALQQLHSISYFRLASYLQSFEIGTNNHFFHENANLGKVINLYVFDRELRSLIFSAIQDVEVALRTRIIHFFSLAHGPFWFMNGSLFKSSSIFNACFEKISIEVGRSREDFIAEYYENYDYPSFPPAWKTMEVLSFGTLSKLYCNFKDAYTKKQIARDFFLPQYVYLENWMKCIAVLRNACAHHARIWNRRYPQIPTMPQHLPSLWITATHFRPSKLYNQLCCLTYLEQSIIPNTDFKEKLIKLLDKYPMVNLRSMGFPQEWRSEPLWICV